MKVLVLSLAIAAGAAFSTPAHADATYSGQFKAVVTSGALVTTAPYDCDCYSYRDLAGEVIDVSFSATLFSNATNYIGDLQPDLTQVSGSFGNATFGFSVSAMNDNTGPYPIDTAGFSGNERAGSAGASNSIFYNNSYSTFSIVYSGAMMGGGPVSGAGTASFSQPGFASPDYYGFVNYRLVSGSTSISGVAAVPEPATWAMMIGGMGVVGGAMRRRRVSTKVTFA